MNIIRRICIFNKKKNPDSKSKAIQILDRHVSPPPNVTILKPKFAAKDYQMIVMRTFKRNDVVAEYGEVIYRQDEEKNMNTSIVNYVVKYSIRYLAIFVDDEK